MEKKVGTRSTKTELLQEYDELFDEHTRLTRELEQLMKEKSEWKKKELPPTMPKTTIARKAENTMESPKEKAPIVSTALENIVQNLKAQRIQVGTAINDLSAQLVSEASQLSEITTEYHQAKQTLESAHTIQIELSTLEKLMKEYDEKSELFQQELQQKNQEFGEKLLSLKRSWQKEQEEYARTIQERDDSEKSNTQREAEEYRYELAQKQEAENQTHFQKVKDLQKELAKIESTKKIEWETHEQRISEQEHELDALKFQVDNFDTHLENQIKAMEEKTRAALKKELQLKAELRAKEVNGDFQIHTTKIQSLEEIIKKQDLLIENLNAQLNASLKQSQELALKAIEGASNARSYLSIKEIAMEQAKNVPKRQ
ncbi:MAG: hypothetical protein ACOY90_18935 [Candidatus Zhuqueibacterota bacterium]